MGVEDEAASEVLDLELAHIAAEKPDQAGAGFDNLRV
jgi:hypothetical protein